jgi:hypothetical protein
VIFDETRSLKDIRPDTHEIIMEPENNDREEFETTEAEPMELTTEQLQNQRTF